MSISATSVVKPAHIVTFTGIEFSILDPQQDQIDIRDIAHALSMQVRYTGHVREFYSVAEHSRAVSLLVPPEDALWGLLHDASEAYLSDLSRPVKHHTPVGPPYLEVEDKIMRAIAAKFGLTLPMPESVKKADTWMLYAEREALMTKFNDNDWPRPDFAIGYPPKKAEELFLQRFVETAPPCRFFGKKEITE